MNKIAAIQMTSSMHLKENLDVAKKLLKKATDAGAQLAVLPEMFAMLGETSLNALNIAETFGNGEIQHFLSEQAKSNNLWIVGGTIPIKSTHPKKFRAACLVFNDQGQCVARYDKMHLFDVKISEKESYYESERTEAGSQLAIVDTPFGKLGLAVCYDIRFPEMFRIMFNQGVEIFALPGAFAVKTGEAHYEILARARAIENFSYFIAACQSGTHENHRKTYGHSLIVSPWGNILDILPSDQGIVITDIDLEYLRKIRRDIPVLEHQKLLLSKFF